MSTRNLGSASQVMDQDGGNQKGMIKSASQSRPFTSIDPSGTGKR